MKLKQLLFTLLMSAPYVTTAGDCCACPSNECDNATSQNLWQPHAFSAYSSTNLIQMKEAYEKGPDSDDDRVFYLSAAGQYMQNFGCNTMGALPFWSGTNTMTIGTNDGESSLDAYQFGMGDVTTPGSIKLDPQVQEFGVDILWYFMQHKTGRGIVAKIDAPLAAMKIKSQLCEDPAVLSNTADEVWTPPYPAVPNRPQTLTEAFGGGAIDGNELAAGVLHPITLYKGRIMGCCPLTAIRLADLSFTLGYNFVNEERGFFMLGLKTTCPTGNVPTGDFVFEPIVGRAGHWGFGAELSSAYRVWSNDCTEVQLWMQGELLHLFNGRTPSYRSFDLLQNGKGSKYLLLQFYAAENPTEDPVNPTGRVASFITQAVNVTTFPVISTIGVEGSFAFMLEARRENWNAGIGAEVWGRTAECLSIDMCSALRFGNVNLNDYAVLGRQISVNQDTEEILDLCEPLATINKSQDRVLTLDSDYDTTLIKDARVASNRIPADVTEALDICGARAPRAVTGKVFGELGYTWRDHCHTPNLTVFGGAEFSDKTSRMFNLWSVALKGSFIF